MSKAKQENAILGGDERLSENLTRESRQQASAERENEDGTAFTSEERNKLFRDEWKQEALPTPPKGVLPGYHLCWLSTTNVSDPIFKRVRMGYELVQTSEIPGWQHYKVKEGEFEGCISCNEMILSKIKNEYYQEIMTHFHHDMPLQEEQMLREGLSTSEKDSSGKDLGEVEGFDHFAKEVRKPHFV